MRRWIPEVGTLYGRVRRPAITLLIALALVAPAAGLSLRGVPLPPPVPGSPLTVLRAGSIVLDGHTEPAGAKAIEANAAARAVDTDAVEAEVAEAKVTEANAAVGPVAQAWIDRALARERQAAAARYARRYGIPKGLAEDIHAAATKENIDPQIAFGLVKTESSFRRTVVSWAGAVGYTQLLPSTARWIAPGTSRSDLFDTETNLRIGFRYLRYLLNKYDGNLRLALTAYNRGPGTVDRLLDRGRNPENGYADRVLGD